MLETLKKEWQAKIAVVIFLVYTGLWSSLQFPQTKNIYILDFYEMTYGLMALFGGICGLFIAKSWGLFRSVMGKAILFLSMGLLAQVFGQICYTYYVYFLHVEVPYPSIGDIGYFGSIPLYFLGVYYLAKASGVKIGLKSIENKIIAVIIPAVILLVGYWLFLKGYDFSAVPPLQIFLDFGYPLGQAIYVSFAFLTLLLSRGVLGGIMRSKIFFLLFALVAQFLADYVFLYQVSRGTWQLGGINEFMYLIAYFLMALGIIQLKTVANQLRQTK
jgi:hypothetical protein